MQFRMIHICLIVGTVLTFLPKNSHAANEDGPDLEQRTLAINMVRAINTAEVSYRSHGNGLFADWASLSASIEFNNVLNRLSRTQPKLKDANLSSMDEILPGWRLQLTVSEDHKSYVVMLMSTVDRCRYAAVSDQEGIIREGFAIGCPSSKSSAGTTDR
jgi:hypothetical protein